jgi:lysyl-tRNA synthetase class 2
VRASEGDWRPSAPFGALRKRAQVLAGIRAFFAARSVLEVETPTLATALVPEPHIRHFVTAGEGSGSPSRARLYLLSSPEATMKRLLAAGSGPIYQICRAYRHGESGALHNPEFTLLEWYRPGFDHFGLMQEVDDLLQQLLGTGAAERVTYRDAFLQQVGIDPFEASAGDLDACARACGYQGSDLDRDGCLDLIMAEAVGPELGLRRPTFVYDYPASQASLARIRPPMAERFELYLGGLEVANGCHELADAEEQERRFLVEISRTSRADADRTPVDERLLAALRFGLPDCAGVAVGVDRLLMHAVGARSIDQVMAFPLGRV